MFVKSTLYIEYFCITDTDGEIKTVCNERVLNPFCIGSLSPALQEEFWNDWFRSMALPKDTIVISAYAVGGGEVLYEENAEDIKVTEFNAFGSTLFISHFNFLRKYFK